MHRLSSATVNRVAPPGMPSRLLALAPLLVACAHAAPAVRPVAATPSAPPTLSIDDESYAARRSDYDALADDDPAVQTQRATLRDGLERYLLDELRRDEDANRLDEAWEDAQRAMTLRTAADLERPAPDAALADAVLSLESAFARRGAARQVLALLAVRIALRPDTATTTRFDRVVAWLRGDEDERCGGPGCDQAIESLQRLVAIWPAPFVVERLAALHWERHRGGGDLTGMGGGSDGDGLAALLHTRSVTRTGLDLARLYLRVGQPEKALAALDQLAGQPGEEPKLREALRRYLAPDATVADALALAVQFIRNPRDRAIGERICQAAARRFPDAAEPALCVGELAIKRQQLVVAIRSFERAVAQNPDDRDAWETLARLHQARLAELVGDERTAELPDALHRAEAFHESARKRFPDAPLYTSLAGAYFEAGRGYYNAGHPDEAARYLERSLAIRPTSFAYEQLAQLRLKQGRAAEAATTFRKAIALADEAHATNERDYWLAKLERGLAEALDGSADGKDAEHAADARRDSLAAWDRLLARHPEGAELAEAQLERGKLLYALGEREQALAAFAAALGADPERGASYAGALSFLIPRDEHDEALTVYHRALGQSAVSEYLKVYCSLWLLDQERRLGLAEDPRAQAFLESVDGDKWYQQLARWATGRTDDAALERRARSDGERCELDFYRAMHRLGEGHADDAHALLQAVVDSNMMAFFEYDMASHYLRHAAPPKPPLPVAAP